MRSGEKSCTSYIDDPRSAAPFSCAPRRERSHCFSVHSSLQRGQSLMSRHITYLFLGLGLQATHMALLSRKRCVFGKDLACPNTAILIIYILKSCRNFEFRSRNLGYKINHENGSGACGQEVLTGHMHVRGLRIQGR